MDEFTPYVLLAVLLTFCSHGEYGFNYGRVDAILMNNVRNFLLHGFEMSYIML